MSNLVTTENRILSMSDKSINSVYQLAEYAKRFPPAQLETLNILHGGMYARTIKIPSGTLVAGALIKLATLIITQGHIAMFVDDETIELQGYNIFAASAKRKQACVAISECYVTMIFPSSAKTVRDAEEEFTDEADLLLTRKDDRNTMNIITGE